MNEIQEHCFADVDVLNGEFIRQCADCGEQFVTDQEFYIYCDECGAKPPSKEEVDEMMDLMDELNASLSALSSNLESGKAKLTPSCKKALSAVLE